MRLNENTMIMGRKVLLVPYETYHVPKYHGWMQTPELLELTASEPLSLEEEYDMQKKWRQDKNKCTFIVVAKRSYEAMQHSQQQAEIESMVGDVNLFLQEDESIAEVEIMIAEKEARGQGLGKEAVCSMMRYGAEELGVKTFMVKVGLSNVPSIHLFSSLGFTETSCSEVFQETTMEVNLSTSLTKLLMSSTSSYALATHCAS